MEYQSGSAYSEGWEGRVPCLDFTCHFSSKTCMREPRSDWCSGGKILSLDRIHFQWICLRDFSQLMICKGSFRNGEFTGWLVISLEVSHDSPYPTGTWGPVPYGGSTYGFAMPSTETTRP